METLAASLVCARSDALTAASCAGNVSAADRCEPSGKAALVIAVTAVAADTASAFETLASPISKPATAAMTPPTRMTVPNNAAAALLPPPRRPGRCLAPIPARSDRHEV